MGKKVSIKDTANHKQVDKETFVYGKNFTQQNLIPEEETEGKKVKRFKGAKVEGLEGAKVKRVEGGKAKSNDFKKVSLYMPTDLWLKYKAHELQELQKGNTVTINGLTLELLEKFLGQ